MSTDYFDLCLHQGEKATLLNCDFRSYFTAKWEKKMTKPKKSEMASPLHCFIFLHFSDDDKD